MTQSITNAIAGGNLSLGKAGLTGLSGAATTISTGKAIDYLIHGAAYTKAAITGGATPTLDAATGASFKPLVAQQAMAGYTVPNVGSACVFVFCLDASGNLKVVQGPVSNYADTSAGSTPLQMPQLPDSVAPFAYAVIKLTSATAASWTFGTGLWNATGVTIDTPVDIGIMPARSPITA
jgi:hypothetical protein